MDLTNRSFLKLLDYTPEEIEGLLDLSLIHISEPTRP